MAVGLGVDLEMTTTDPKGWHKAMGAFQLPEPLPDSIAALDELQTAAGAEFDALKAKVENGEDLTEEEIQDLQYLAGAIEAIGTAHEAASTAAEAKSAKISDLISSTSARLTKPGNSEQAPADDSAAETPEAVAAAAGTPAGTNKFAGVAKSADVEPGKDAVGFRMTPNVPDYKPGIVGFADVANSMARMGRSGGIVRTNKPAISPLVYDYKTGKSATQDFSQAMSFATIDRGLSEEQIVRSAEEFEVKLEAVTAAANLRPAKYDNTGALVAAAGWCAPSETIWDFCDVTEDDDLLTLPELNIPRGGLRFPEEPDMTSFYASLPFFYTAAELEAGGITKPCVEIPCVEFDEITKNATGICITVGLLQEKAWPELVAKYLAEVTKAHMHDQQARSIAAMTAGSGTAVVIPVGSSLGAIGSVLNGLAWEAKHIRILEHMGRRARIEGVAPSWLLEILQADLALQQGLDVKAVTEQMVDQWLAARNIYIQWVSDWQARGAGQVGYAGLAAGAPAPVPATVDVLLYPAGAWFRHVDNVIEVGNLYDKAQLQSNTKTALFTEDEFAVGKRCHTSRLIRVPLCVSGAIGAREFVTCNLTEAPGAA